MKANKFVPFMLRRGDGSTLSLDFTAMSGLDSRFTFTRASIGTYIDSAGLVASVSNDVPRFDHDPTTLAPRGLLLEGSATNLLCWSETFATSGGTTNWFYNLNSVSSESVTNPAGGATSIQFRETGGSGPLGQNVSAPSTDLYTFSVWVRGSVYNGVTTTQVRVGLFTTVFETVTISKLSGPGSASGTGLCTVSGLSTTEWTKIQITTASAITSGTALRPFLYPEGSSFNPDASFLVWGAQLEVGSGASSYIPTGASTVQRAADSCVMTGANFSSWFNSTEGTFLARGQRRLTSNTGMLLSANDASNSEAMGLGSSTTGKWLIRDGGSDVADITPGTATANTVYRIAGAYAVNDAQAAFNGTLGTADTSLTLPTVNQLDIGRDRVTVYLDGHVELIKYWPTRLPNSTLQALTS